MDHLEDEVSRSETMNRAKAELIGDDVEDKFASMEKEDQINRLLAELKARRRLNP